MIKHFALLGVFAVVMVAAVPAQQPAAVKAFTGLRLIDGTDRAPVDNATIVVRDGRIVAAGPAASVTVPAGAERVALAGKTRDPRPRSTRTATSTTLDRDLEDLRRTYGVTTVFSLGDDGSAPGGASRRGTPGDAVARTARASSSPGRCSTPTNRRGGPRRWWPRSRR